MKGRTMAHEKEWMQLFDNGTLIADGFGRVYRAKSLEKSLEIPRLLGRVERYVYITCKFAGKVRALKAHRLIWWLFKGPIPAGLEINHKNGDKLDNRIGNLELMTHAENVQHSYDELGRARGEDHYKAKLCEEDVKKIRELQLTGYTKCELAKMFGVTQTNIWFIINRKSWKHI